ncbi:MAG TPA: cupin domain-containing protein [Casimicrobiaceae bacterium]|nr:cupin domain-containing protein [Casimicrobiaceae bacterium]
MQIPSHPDPCPHAELAQAYGLQATSEVEARAIEAHLPSCEECRHEVEALRPLVDAFAFWPTDILTPPRALESRLADRLAADTGGERVSPSPQRTQKPDWNEVGPGISCKLLTSDNETRMVGMLVRLAPGAHYPPHTHGAVEELHLLDGELWIDERKLQPGDYNRGEPGTADKSVWSETGCTCVLVTSMEDILG